MNLTNEKTYISWSHKDNIALKIISDYSYSQYNYIYFQLYEFLKVTFLTNLWNKYNIQYGDRITFL